MTPRSDEVSAGMDMEKFIFIFRLVNAGCYECKSPAINCKMPRDKGIRSNPSNSTMAKTETQPKAQFLGEEWRISGVRIKATIPAQTIAENISIAAKISQMLSSTMNIRIFIRQPLLEIALQLLQ